MSAPDGPPAAALALFQFISLGLTVALGGAGNALVLCAFARHLRLRRSPHTLMTGFVALDGLRAAICLPVVFATVPRWSHGQRLCEALAFGNAFCAAGNGAGALGMALDRYADHRYRACYRRRASRVALGAALLLASWGAALLAVLPASLHRRPPAAPLFGAECTFPSHYAADAPSLMATLAAAHVLTDLVYARLFLMLRRRRRMRPLAYEPAVSDSWGFYDPRSRDSVRRRWLAESFSDEPVVATVERHPFRSGGGGRVVPTNYEVALWRSRKQRDREKLTELCFAVHALFSAAWLPYVVVGLWFAGGDAAAPQWLEVGVTWLSYFQVIVTPVAFFALSGFTRRDTRRRLSPTLSDSSA